MTNEENDKKRITKIRELISSFQYDKISDKEIIFICDCCSLYKAKYNDNEYIFILEFNFFEQSILEEEDNYEKIEKIIKNEDYMEHTLKLKGIYYNYNENIFSLIYNNDNNDLSLFVDNSLIAYNTDQTINLLIKIQLFYNVLNIIKKIHNEGEAISLLHPNLIFISKSNGNIYTLDTTFFKFNFCFNKYVNFPICSYFGIYDMEQINKFEDNDKGIEYYQKADIFLCCALLVYFMRLKPTKASLNFDITLNEIGKVFFLQEDNFNKFTVSIKFEPLLEQLIKTSLSINYDNIVNISELINKLLSVIDLKLKEIKQKCSICSEELNTKESFLSSNKAQVKTICNQCGKITCSKCIKEHPHQCENEQSVQLLKEYQDKLIFNKYTEQFEIIRDVKMKDVINVFSDSVEYIYKEFSTKNENAKRRIKKEENYINDLSLYVKQLLIQFADEKYKQIKNQIAEIKKSDDTTNINRSSSIKNFIRSSSSSKAMNISQVSQGDNVIKEKLDKIKEDIDNFKKFTSESSELFTLLLYDDSIVEVFDLLHAKFSNFNKKINDDFLNYYKSSMSTLLKDTIDIYSKSISIEEDDILNEYLLETNDSKCIRNKNIFYLQNDQFNVYELIKFNTEEDPELKNPIKVTLKNNTQIKFDGEWRTLHLKTICIFTKNTTAIAVKYKNENNIHEYLTLPSMQYNHTHHMMIAYNLFNIIVMGGDDTSGVEIYNFGKEKWEIMPSLSHERGFGCAYLHNERYIYVFGGVDSNKKQCDDIEVFDLVNRSDNKWNSIMLKSKGGRRPPCIKGSGTRKINDNEIMIVGGEGSGVKFFGYCHYLNLNEYTIWENKDMKCNPNYHLENMMIELSPGNFFEK